MSWDAIVPIADKIGLVAVVILAGFIIAKLVAKYLVDVAIWSSKSPDEPKDDSIPEKASDDPPDNAPGLHVYAVDADEHRIVDKSPAEGLIRDTIRSVDWAGGFHLVWLVKPSGESLEVGGSLAPDIGLSSAYRDSSGIITKVIKEPPASVEHMEDLLVSFHRGDGRWEQLTEYE
ncbi:MAG: hypothetical protein QNI96_00965 [Woeseiaceae bacterium]|nr:hypothetical protein [Woeseiaceae bacterium]